jgi:hypothetical protein
MSLQRNASGALWAVSAKIKVDCISARADEPIVIVKPMYKLKINRKSLHSLYYSVSIMSLAVE